MEHVGFLGTPTFPVARLHNHARRVEHSKSIRRTLHAHRAPVQDMRVDHCRLQRRMTEQLLNGANVATTLEQVRRE